MAGRLSHGQAFIRFEFFFLLIGMIVHGHVLKKGQRNCPCCVGEVIVPTELLTFDRKYAAAVLRAFGSYVIARDGTGTFMECKGCMMFLATVLTALRILAQLSTL